MVIVSQHRMKKTPNKGNKTCILSMLKFGYRAIHNAQEPTKGDFQ